MNGIFDRRGMVFFVVYVFVSIAVASAIVGYTDGGTDLTNPIYILGTALLATFLFQKFSAKRAK